MEAKQRVSRILWSDFGTLAPIPIQNTHVANVDDLAPLAVGGCKVGKRVGRGRGSRLWGTSVPGTWGPSGTPTVAAPTSITATKSTTTSEAAAAKASAKAAAAPKAPTSTKAPTSHSIGKAIHTDLEDATIPVVAIKLLNRIASIIGCFVDDDTRTLGATIGSHMNVGANDAASAGFSHQSVWSGF